MAADTLNDNADACSAPSVDAHGEAAMLLVESLIHGLIASDVLSVQDAVEIVDVAVEVKTDLARDQGVSPAEQRRSLGLLKKISISLQRDIP